VRFFVFVARRAVPLHLKSLLFIPCTLYLYSVVVVVVVFYVRNDSDKVFKLTLFQKDLLIAEATS